MTVLLFRRIPPQYCCLLTKSCLTLCDPMDCSPPGSSVHGISQARILGGLLFPSPGDLSNLRIKPRSLALAGRFFTTSATWEVLFSFEHGYILLSSHQKIGQEKYEKFHIIYHLLTLYFIERNHGCMLVGLP